MNPAASPASPGSARPGSAHLPGMSDLSVIVPARTLTVLAEPMTATEALGQMDHDGLVQATVSVPIDEMIDPDGDYDTFYDRLCNRLIEGVAPHGLDFTVVGIAADLQSLYVQVTQDMGDLMDDSVARSLLVTALDVPADVIEDARKRLLP